MSKYLDPKADLTFKKVFGEHRDLVVSFLNAMLPFDSPEEEIKEVLEYLDPELVPRNPLKKYSVVDLRCRDARGRQFVVEMQMMWTSAFKQRVLFNASKAYVSQLETGDEYELLQPVYSLNIVNDTYCDSKSYYHDYRIVAIEETDEVIEGLRFIFIELPKFTPQTYSGKKMQVLWLRYLTEINAKTREAPKDLMAVPVIRKAVKQLEESAFTDQQLLMYDKFWDMVSTSRTLINGATREAMRKGLKEGMEKGMEKGLEEGRRKGLEQGLQEGIQQGIQQGLQQGIEEGIRQGVETGLLQERLRIVRKLREMDMPEESIAQLTGLTTEDLAVLDSPTDSGRG